MAGILKNTKTKNSMPGFFGNQGLTTIQNASPVTATPIKTQRRIFMKIIPRGWPILLFISVMSTMDGVAAG